MLRDHKILPFCASCAGCAGSNLSCGICKYQTVKSRHYKIDLARHTRHKQHRRAVPALNLLDNFLGRLGACRAAHVINTPKSRWSRANRCFWAGPRYPAASGIGRPSGRTHRTHHTTCIDQPAATAGATIANACPRIWQAQQRIHDG
jgi:hypothetical protein